MQELTKHRRPETSRRACSARSPQPVPVRVLDIFISRLRRNRCPIWRRERSDAKGGGHVGVRQLYPELAVAETHGPTDYNHEYFRQAMPTAPTAHSPPLPNCFQWFCYIVRLAHKIKVLQFTRS